MMAGGAQRAAPITGTKGSAAASSNPHRRRNSLFFFLSFHFPHFPRFVAICRLFIFVAAIDRGFASLHHGLHARPRRYTLLWGETARRI